MGEVVCDSFLFTMLALRGVGSGPLLVVLGEGRGGEGEGRELRWANHTQKHKQTRRRRREAASEFQCFHCATSEMTEREIVLSLCLRWGAGKGGGVGKSRSRGAEPNRSATEKKPTQDRKTSNLGV